MKESIKKQKEAKILKQAEKIFAEFGYDKANMDAIAAEANCSKVTLYSYFGSKENLYMAITYKAFQKLIDTYYQTIDEYADKSRLECVQALWIAYLTFSRQNIFYHRTLLDFLRLIRAYTKDEFTASKNEALQSSIFFRKTEDIQYLPVTIITAEIKAGQEEGSIKNARKAEEIFLTQWALIIGFTQLNDTVPKSQGTTLFKVPLEQWKVYVQELLTNILLDTSPSNTNN